MRVMPNIQSALSQLQNMACLADLQIVQLDAADNVDGGLQEMRTIFAAYSVGIEIEKSCNPVAVLLLQSLVCGLEYLSWCLNIHPIFPNVFSIILVACSKLSLRYSD